MIKEVVGRTGGHPEEGALYVTAQIAQAPRAAAQHHLVCHRIEGHVLTGAT